MQCSVCGEQLSAGATACPRCGSFVPYGAGPNMYNPTVMSTGNLPSGQGQPQGQAQQSTVYGSNPYGDPNQNPYSPNPYPYPYTNPYTPTDSQTLPVSPYNMQQQTPLPPSFQYQMPPQPQKRPNMGLIIGLVVLAIIVVAGGFFALSHISSSGQGQSTATATPQGGNGNANANPYPPHTGTLALDDPMTDNTKGYKWDETTMTGVGSCGFSGGAYHITTIKQNEGLICNPEASAIVFSNLTFEAKLKIVTGDEAGIVIRVDQQQITGYIFAVDTQGNYYLMADDGPNNAPRILRQGANAAILKGLNQTNLLAVVASGTSMYLYINGQYVDQGTDSKYTQGQIGLYGTSQTTCDIVASDARVWKL